MNQSQSIQPSGVPIPIIKSLRGVRSRVRGVMLARGVLAVAATVVIATLVVMGADALLNASSPGARWALTGSIIAATFVGLCVFLFYPLSKKVSLREIARVLEARHPEMEERLSSAIGLGLVGGEDPNAGSDELRETVVTGAMNDAAAISPGAEFRARYMRRQFMVAGLALGVFVALFVIWPDQVGRLLARVLNPVSGHGNIYASGMEVTPGSTWVAEGEPITIEFRTNRALSERAELHRSPAGESGAAPTVESMRLIERDDVAGGARFRLTFPAAKESFHYKITSGASVSDTYHIEVKRYPQVEHMTLTYDYPTYTGLPNREETETAGEIAAMPGTRVSVEAFLSAPVKTATAHLPVERSIESGVGANAEENPRAQWGFEMADDMGGHWSYALTDGFGLKTESGELPIQVVPDRPPSIVMVAPAQQRIAAKADAKVKLTYRAEDDFGLANAKLAVSVDGGKPRVRSQRRRADAEKALWTGEATVDLGKFVKADTRVVTASLVAVDNRPDKYGGGQAAATAELLIVIDHTDGPLKDPGDYDPDAIAKLIQEAIEALEEAKEDAEFVTEAMAGYRPPSKAPEKLAELQAAAEAGNEKVQEAKQLLEHAMREKEAQSLGEVSENEIAAAKNAAAEIPNEQTNEERAESSEEATKQLAEAIEKLEELKESLGVSPEEKMEALLVEQEALAAEAAAAAAENPEAPMGEEWKERQKAVAAEIAAMESPP